MIRPEQRNRLKRYVLPVLLLWGFVLRFAIIVNADAEGLVKIVPDDGFYYFQTADNLVEGYGSSFDRIHDTNGYHPLWMIALLPVAAVTNSPLALAKLALLLGVVFDLICALLIAQLLRDITQSWWIPLVGTALYYFNPSIVLASLNGLETSLAQAIFALALLLTLAGHFTDRRVYPALLGSVLGLLFLARTDTAFYIGVLGMAGLLQVRTRARQAVLVGAGLVVISPWLIWSMARFGSPVQVSGNAVPFVENYRLIESSGGSALGTLPTRVNYFIDFLLNYIPPLFRVSGWFLAALMLSLLVYGVCWTIMGPENRFRVWVLIGLWGAGLLLIGVHVAIRIYPRPWYFSQLVIVSVVMLSLAIHLFDPGATFQRVAEVAFPGVELANPFMMGVVAVLVSLFLLLPLFQAKDILAETPPYPHQPEMLDAALWLSEHTEDDAVVAAFNAGIFGFFSERRVVNLDGVMNNAAYEALMDHDLMRVIRQADIRYFVDYVPVMFDHYDPFWGDDKARVEFVEVAEFDRDDVSWENAVIRVYHLELSSELQD